MVENNIFTDQPDDKLNRQAKTPIHAMITLDRAQKLDLLTHLITNLRQSLVVCGPAGIGKTTLLNVLIERAQPDWYCLYIQDSHQVSFENIQGQLIHFIKSEQTEPKNLDLGGYLAQLALRNQKLVLIVDEAGSLVPGLIDALNRYALANPALRIIFSLTQDELYVKSVSDRTLEDCHFIELPPLSEKQCGEFLYNLSGKPGATISFNAINDGLVAHLYQETHGIPGRIMKALPNLSEYGQARTVKWIPTVLFGLIVVTGLTYWAWSEDGSARVAIVEPLSENNLPIKRVNLAPPKIQKNSQPWVVAAPETAVEVGKKSASTIRPVIKTAEIDVDLNRRPSGPAKAAKGKAEGSDNQAAGTRPSDTAEEKQPKHRASEREQDDTQPVQATPVVTEAEPVPGTKPFKPVVEPRHEEEKAEKINKPEPSKAVSEADDRQWLFKQPSKKYTLQLIALSNRQSLAALMKKHSSLRQHFKYIKTNSGQKEKYILLYGSFNSYASASSAMRKLPKQFRKSWVRRFRILQNDVKNAD